MSCRTVEEGFALLSGRDTTLNKKTAATEAFLTKIYNDGILGAKKTAEEACKMLRKKFPLEPNVWLKKEQINTFFKTLTANRKKEAARKEGESKNTKVRSKSSKASARTMPNDVYATSASAELEVDSEDSEDEEIVNIETAQFIQEATDHVNIEASTENYITSHPLVVSTVVGGCS